MAVNSSALDPYEEIIEELVERNDFTHREVAKYLNENYGVERGCSVRSLQEFCRSRNIHRFASSRMSQSDIDDTVKNMILEVSK